MLTINEMITMLKGAECTVVLYRDRATRNIFDILIYAPGLNPLFYDGGLKFTRSSLEVCDECVLEEDRTEPKVWAVTKGEYVRVTEEKYHTADPDQRIRFTGDMCNTSGTGSPIWGCFEDTFFVHKEVLQRNDEELAPLYKLLGVEK